MWCDPRAGRVILQVCRKVPVSCHWQPKQVAKDPAVLPVGGTGLLLWVLQPRAWFVLRVCGGFFFCFALLCFALLAEADHRRQGLLGRLGFGYRGWFPPCSSGSLSVFLSVPSPLFVLFFFCFFGGAARTCVSFGADWLDAVSSRGKPCDHSYCDHSQQPGARSYAKGNEAQQPLAY